MTFREQATADLPTFVNPDEFGELVTIESPGGAVTVDGRAVACVFTGNGDTPDSNDGVINRDTLMYVRASDLYQVPAVGQRLTIDDEKADVSGVDEQMGILAIRLVWLDS